MSKDSENQAAWEDAAATGLLRAIRRNGLEHQMLSELPADTRREVWEAEARHTNREQGR